MVNTVRITLVSLTLLSMTLPCLAYDKVLTVGVQNHDARWDTGDASFDAQDFDDTAYHLGFRLYNQIHTNHYLGVGLDYDELLSETIIGYRALDYQYTLSEHVKAGAFFGAASLDNVFPQNGYYYGVNASLTLLPKTLSIQYEFKVGDGLARDRVNNVDPQGERPDIFLDFTAHVLAVRWQF